MSSLIHLRRFGTISALLMASTAWPALAQTGTAPAAPPAPTASSSASADSPAATTQDGADQTSPTAIDGSAQAPADPSATGNADIVVTGYRASLKLSLIHI